jgi:hypothetical protein
VSKPALKTFWKINLRQMIWENKVRSAVSESAKNPRRKSGKQFLILGSHPLLAGNSYLGNWNVGWGQARMKSIKNDVSSSEN